MTIITTLQKSNFHTKFVCCRVFFDGSSSFACACLNVQSSPAWMKSMNCLKRRAADLPFFSSNHFNFHLNTHKNLRQIQNWNFRSGDVVNFWPGGSDLKRLISTWINCFPFLVLLIRSRCWRILWTCRFFRQNAAFVVLSANWTCGAVHNRQHRLKGGRRQPRLSSTTAATSRKK